MGKACSLRLEACSLRLEACCLRLGPSCASTNKICGQRFGVPQAWPDQHCCWSQIHTLHAVSGLESLALIIWIRDQLLSHTGRHEVYLAYHIASRTYTNVIAVDIPQLQHLIPDPPISFSIVWLWWIRDQSLRAWTLTFYINIKKFFSISSCISFCNLQLRFFTANCKYA